MVHRGSTCALALTAALMGALGAARSAEAPKYPDWQGQWERFVVRGVPGQPSHDQTKPWGLGQEAPLTLEYKKVLLDSMADQAAGGVGNFPTAFGRASGMPYMMMAFGPMEWVVTPNTTYILIGWHDHYRRIFTDGRDWPESIDPTYAGYSIGRWIGTEGAARMTRSWWRRGVSRVRVPSTRPACRSPPTISRSSRNACTATRSIRGYCTTR